MKYILNGKEVTQEEWTANSVGVDFDGQAPAAPSSSCWPMKSKGLGVKSYQVQEANEYSRKHGLPVEYEQGTGQAILNSANDRRQVLKHYGMVDKDSFI